MIYVDRGAVPVPDEVSSARMTAELNVHTRDGLVGALSARQVVFGAEARDALRELFRGKCAYCETPISATTFAAIDHFRPLSGALGLDGKISPDHYLWLAFEWSNLYPVCPVCNRLKGSRFPVEGERAPLGATGEALRSERALLIDPCVDEPAEHLIFQADGSVLPRTNRGSITIDVLQLNRDPLRSHRERVAADVQRWLDLFLATAGDPTAAEAERHVTEAVGPGAPHAAVARQALANFEARKGVIMHAVPRPLLSAYGVSQGEKRHAKRQLEKTAAAQRSHSVETEDRTSRVIYFSAARRIEQIELRNFRGIDKLILAFPPPADEREAWLALLGENAVGKSSVLQALALTLMGEEHANNLGLRPSEFVREGSARAVATVTLTGLPEPIELTIRRGAKQFKINPPEPKVLLLAYGATRLLPRSVGRATEAQRYVRIRNLFDPTAPLSDATAWLETLDDAHFQAVADALHDLLMLERGQVIHRDEDGVHADLDGVRLPLSALSDGLQSVVALACDIMISLLEKWPSMDVAEGIVLIDELEVHLHPRWKIQIVERLRQVFPHVAFAVTTHDPLCLHGLGRNEVAVLGREGTHTTVVTDIPDIEDLRSDQLLTSVLFGMSSSRSLKYLRARQRYIELLGRLKRTPEEEEELELLRERLKRAALDGETAVEREQELKRAMEVVNAAAKIRVRPLDEVFSPGPVQERLRNLFQRPEA